MGPNPHLVRRRIVGMTFALFTGRAAGGLLVLALLATSCGTPSAPPPAAPPGPTAATAGPRETTEVSPEQLEQFRSLGYLSTRGLPRLGAGQGVQRLDRTLASPGYTLVVFAGSCECQLLSLEGEVVRSWKDAPCHRWEHAELLPDGDLVVVGAQFDESAVEDPIDSGRYLMRLSWDSEILWRNEMNAHHDVSLTPDGMLLTLVFRTTPDSRHRSGPRRRRRPADAPHTGRESRREPLALRPPRSSEVSVPEVRWTPRR